MRRPFSAYSSRWRSWGGALVVGSALSTSIGCPATKSCTDIPHPEYDPTSASIAGSRIVIGGVLLDVRGKCPDTVDLVGMVHVLDLSSGASTVARLPGISGPFVIATSGLRAFAPLLSGSNAGMIVDVALDDPSDQRIIDIGGTALEAAMLGDGSGLAVAAGVAPLPVVDVETGAVGGIDVPAPVVAFAQGAGTLFASLSTGGIAKIDVASRTVDEVLATPVVTDLETNGEWLFYASPDSGTVGRMTLSSGLATVMFPGTAAEVTAMASSHLAIAFSGVFSRLPVVEPAWTFGTYVIDFNAQTVIPVPIILVDPPLALDGERALTVNAAPDWNGGATVVDLATGGRSLAGPDGSRLAVLRRLPDGRILAISDVKFSGRPATWDRAVFILDPTTLQEVSAYPLVALP